MIIKRKYDIKKGEKYGFLTNEKEVEGKGKRNLFHCECGGVLITSVYDVISGKTKSCGCICKKGIHITHKMSKHKIYRVFDSMKRRCNSIKDSRYNHYGGRGIKCEWNSFEEFMNDMFPYYVEGLTIERINNNGNYCKSNCRWATNLEQSRNKRTTIFIGGICLKLFCNIHNINYGNIIARLSRRRTKIYKIINYICPE